MSELPNNNEKKLLKCANARKRLWLWKNRLKNSTPKLKNKNEE